MRLRGRLALSLAIAVMMISAGTAATFATSKYFGSSGSSSYHEYHHDPILKTCAYLKVHFPPLWYLLCKKHYH
jgi:hypothetical protein